MKVNGDGSLMLFLPPSWDLWAAACLCVCVCVCVHAFVRAQKEYRKPCERWRALFETCSCYVVRAVFCFFLSENFSRSLELPALFQPNWSPRAAQRRDVWCDQRLTRVESGYTIFKIDSILCYFSSIQFHQCRGELEAINKTSNVAAGDLFCTFFEV